MIITRFLVGEHGVFYVQFNHLEKTIPIASALELVRSQVALLREALSTHATLEDELLFSALDPHLSQKGPLSVMRMEHDEIENTLAQVQQSPNLAKAQKLALHALQVAREHFAKEERVLFPLAHQTLDEKTLAQLGVQWAQRRGVIIR